MNGTSEKTIEVLNDLILLNSDRSIAYEKAAKQLSPEDADLQKSFNRMAADSRKYLYELAGHIDPSGKEFVIGTFPSQGKIYNEWTAARISINGKDRQSLFNSCECCEKAIAKAYEEAWREETPDEIKKILTEQKNSLQRSFEKIQELQEVQHV